MVLSTFKTVTLAALVPRLIALKKTPDKDSVRKGSFWATVCEHTQYITAAKSQPQKWEADSHGAARVRKQREVDVSVAHTFSFCVSPGSQSFERCLH